MEAPLKAAYVFPGQGSQYVGMGRDLYEGFKSAKAIFDAADKTLGFPLSELCFEGPEEVLRDTANAQPALVVTSLATLAAVREAHMGKGIPQPSFVAGHSLGEYTALAVSGVIDFGTAIYLARQRGRLMSEASRLRPGSMAAVLGMSEADLSRVCAESGVVIANINCPGQLVISGDSDRVAKAVSLVQASGKGKAIPLAVSAAFHSPLMQPALEGMRELISNLNFAEPMIPVVANATATAVNSAREIKEELISQICSCVRWQQSVELMLAGGVNTFYEIGPGKVLSGLIKRTDRNAKVLNIGDVNSVRAQSG